VRYRKEKLLDPTGTANCKALSAGAWFFSLEESHSVRFIRVRAE